MKNIFKLLGCEKIEQKSLQVIHCYASLAGAGYDVVGVRM